MGGHSGVYRTLAVSGCVFSGSVWYAMSRNSYNATQSASKSKNPPLSQGIYFNLSSYIPSTIWEDVSMDFITVLPPVIGKSVIVVVVDRFSKYYHLGALLASYTAANTVEYFVQQIVRLHGIPKMIYHLRSGQGIHE